MTANTRATFTTTDSEYIGKYNNTECVVLGELDPSRYDKEDVGPMYSIKLFDGAIIEAFEDELTPIK